MTSGTKATFPTTGPARVCSRSGGRQKTGIRIGKQAGDVVLDGNTVKAETTVLDERVK